MDKFLSAVSGNKFRFFWGYHRTHITSQKTFRFYMWKQMVNIIIAVLQRINVKTIEIHNSLNSKQEQDCIAYENNLPKRILTSKTVSASLASLTQQKHVIPVHNTWTVTSALPAALATTNNFSLRELAEDCPTTSVHRGFLPRRTASKRP
jgi:hypothetical protein